MKSSIKIIKRKQAEATNESKHSQVERSAEESTREIATTIKSWIAEVQQRKRAPGLPSSPRSVAIA